MSADYRELVEFQKKVQRMSQQGKDAFFQEAANELAGRLLRKVKRRTPTGVYPHRTGGTLKREWKVGAVRKEGNNYVVELNNPTEYASYVEFGHRTANHTGWVPGRFMLTISERELNAIAPRVLQAKLNRWLSEALR